MAKWFCAACKKVEVAASSLDPSHCSGTYPFQCCCICAADQGWQGLKASGCPQCMAKAGMEGGDAAVGTAADNPLETYNLGGIFHTGASPVAGKEPGHTNTAKEERLSDTPADGAMGSSPPVAETQCTDRSLPDGWTTVCTDTLLRKCQTDTDADFAPETMLRRLQHFVQEHGSSVVFRQFTGVEMDAELSQVTFEMLGNQVRKCAHALIKAGVRRCDKVCIAGAGSPTWAVAYLGTMSAGAIPCTLYANDSIGSLRSLAHRCGARALLTAEDRIAKAVVSNLRELPNLSLVVLWDEEGRSAGRLPRADEARVGGAGADWKGAFRWKDLMEPEPGPDVRTEHDRRLASVFPGTCAAIVNTPGTSGQPKAVMLSHDNWSWTAQAVATQIGVSSSDNLMACLPIASATGQLLCIHIALVSGCTVTFPPVLPEAKSWEEVYVSACRSSGAGGWPSKLVTMLKVVRPTILVGGGCMWEIIASALRGGIQAAQGATAKKYAWALQQGREAGMRLQGTGSIRSNDVGSKGMSWGIAKRVMFQKIWSEVGLDRCRYAAGLGAYCNTDAIELLLSVGVPVMWMYGTAECSGIATLSSSSKGHNKIPGFRIGYSGKALKGTTVMLRRRAAATGSGLGSSFLHVTVKGRNVMMGYAGDAARTAAVMDPDGTLRSDDYGEIDWATQLVCIEAQEGAIMQLSTDKVVTASRVENAMRKELPILSNVVAIAHGLPFVACLLCLETQSSPGEASDLSPEVIRTLREWDVHVKTVEEARQSPQLTERIIHGVQQVNLALGPEHAPVKRFFILAEDLRVENNELTPVMSLRRSVIVEKFNDIIKDMYDDSLPRRQKTPQTGSGTSADAVLPQVRDIAVKSQGNAQRASLQDSTGEPRGSPDLSALHSLSPGEGNTALGRSSGAASNGQHHDDTRGWVLQDEHHILQHHEVFVDGQAAHDEVDEQLRQHARLETAVLQTNPAISNVMVVGENEPFLSCLISLKTISEGDYALHPDAVAAARAFGSTSETVLEAKDDAHFRAFLVDSIARVNQRVDRAQLVIRKFIILLVDFLPTVADPCQQGPAALTLGMRTAIKRRFDKVIGSIYAGHDHETPMSKFGGVVGASLNQTRSPSEFREAPPSPSHEARGLSPAWGAAGSQNGALPQKENTNSNVQDLSAFFSSDNTSWYPSALDQALARALDQAPEQGLMPSAYQAQSPAGGGIIKEAARRADNQASVHASANSNGHVHTPEAGNCDPLAAAYDDVKGQENGELVQLVLDIDMAHVLPRMQGFCTGLHADVYRALDVHRHQVLVRKVFAGSVIVNVALFASDGRSDDVRSALDLVRVLQQQAADSASVLRAGAYTRSLVSVRHLPHNDAVVSTVSKETASHLSVSRSGGVGLVLQADDQDRVRISRIIPGSPAALTREVCQDDIVVEVDGQQMAGAGAEAIVAALQGQKGSLVRMAVMRGDLSHTVYMVRGAARDSISLGNGSNGTGGTTDEHCGLAPEQRSPLFPASSMDAAGVIEGARRRSRISGAGVPKNRVSIGTPGSVKSFSDDGSGMKRELQVVNMAFEDIKVLVWRRDGSVIAQHVIPPNGEFPADGDWPIPTGRDVCMTVLLSRETGARASFCLPEFDKRSVRLRVEVDSAQSLLSVAPMLRKGKPLQGNVDAYSLRLNALPETAGPIM